MAWFKVDDTFAMHEKVLAAGNSAIGLWVRSGAWSMQQLTDGFVPDHVVRALGTPKERRHSRRSFVVGRIRRWRHLPQLGRAPAIEGSSRSRTSGG